MNSIAWSVAGLCFVLSGAITGNTQHFIAGFLALILAKLEEKK